MATITENLKRILSAVYGRDVRQAIHDSIEQCYDTVDDTKSVVQDILGKLSVPVTFTATKQSVWYMYTSGNPGAIERKNANEYCESVAIPVGSGETYHITIYNDSSNGGFSTAAKVMFATKGASDQYYKYAAGYLEPNYAGNDWMVTAPEDTSGKQMYLLLYSTGVNMGGISKVRKMRV